MSELLSYLDEIPVIRNDLGVSVRKYSEAYGRMVHSPYGSNSYKKESYKINLELRKIKSTVEEAEAIKLSDIPKPLTSRMINHMDINALEIALNESMLYKDLIDHVYTVYSTIYNYHVNATLARSNAQVTLVIKSLNISKQDAFKKREAIRKLSRSYARAIDEISFYVRNGSELSGFKRPQSAIESANCDFNTHTLAYLNTLTYAQLIYVCDTFLTTQEISHINFIKNMLRYAPNAPSPSHILDLAISDDKNIAITKYIVENYTAEDIDIDVSKAVSAKSYNTFNLLLEYGFKEFFDDNTCASRISIIPPWSRKISSVRLLEDCNIESESLTDFSVIAMNCIEWDNDAVFDYLLRHKCYVSSYVMNYNAIFSLISDLMKYKKFRFYYIFLKYYEISKETLQRIEDDINRYSFIKCTYPKESLVWLHEMIKGKEMIQKGIQYHG